MDDFIVQLVQVFYGEDDLPDYHFGLLLRQFLVLFKIMGEVKPVTVLQNSAEGSRVDLDGVEKSHNIGVDQYFMHFVLPDGMFYVVLLGRVVP